MSRSKRAVAAKPPEALPASDVVALAEDLTRAIRELANAQAASALPDETLQKLFEALVEIYGQKREQGSKALPMTERSPAAATAVLLTASGLLKAADLELFELGMFQSWTGNR